MFRRLLSTLNPAAAPSRLAAVSIILLPSRAMNPPVQAVADLLFDRELTCVLIKRATRTGDFWSGDIALPGGKAENSETSLECARRETFEEIGLDLNSAAFRHLGQGQTISVNDGKPNAMKVVPHFFVWTAAQSSASFPPFVLSEAEVAYAFLHSVDYILSRSSSSEDYYCVDLESRYIPLLERQNRPLAASLSRVVMRLFFLRTVDFPSISLTHVHGSDRLWGMTRRILLENLNSGAHTSALPILFGGNVAMRWIGKTLHYATSGRLNSMHNLISSVCIFTLAAAGLGGAIISASLGLVR